MERQLGIIDEAVANGYLVGDSATYADFNLFATLYYMPAFPESAELIKKCSNIQAYLALIGGRESAQKTAPPKKS